MIARVGGTEDWRGKESLINSVCICDFYEGLTIRWYTKSRDLVAIHFLDQTGQNENLTWLIKYHRMSMSKTENMSANNDLSPWGASRREERVQSWQHVWKSFRFPLLLRNGQSQLLIKENSRKVIFLIIIFRDFRLAF